MRFTPKTRNSTWMGRLDSMSPAPDLVLGALLPNYAIVVAAVGNVAQAGFPRPGPRSSGPCSSWSPRLESPRRSRILCYRFSAAIQGLHWLSSEAGCLHHGGHLLFVAAAQVHTFVASDTFADIWIGAGTQEVTGTNAALLLWLARSDGIAVSSKDALPVLPDWG